MSAKTNKLNDFVSEDVGTIIDSGGTLAEKAGIPLTYSKRQFLSSEKYKKHRDLLNVLLEDNRFYSKSEAEKMIDKYLKGKVK